MDAEPEDRDCKGFEHPQILVSAGVLEQIPQETKRQLCRGKWQGGRLPLEENRTGCRSTPGKGLFFQTLAESKVKSVYKQRLDRKIHS